MGPGAAARQNVKVDGEGGPGNLACPELVPGCSGDSDGLRAVLPMCTLGAIGSAEAAHALERHSYLFVVSSGRAEPVQGENEEEAVGAATRGTFIAARRFFCRTVEEKRRFSNTVPPVGQCICSVFPLPSWLRQCLCFVFPLPSWLRQCLFFRPQVPSARAPLPKEGPARSRLRLQGMGYLSTPRREWLHVVCGAAAGIASAGHCLLHPPRTSFGVSVAMKRGKRTACVQQKNSIGVCARRG